MTYVKVPSGASDLDYRDDKGHCLLCQGQLRGEGDCPFHYVNDNAFKPSFAPEAITQSDMAEEEFEFNRGWMGTPDPTIRRRKF